MSSSSDWKQLFTFRILGTSAFIRKIYLFLKKYPDNIKCYISTMEVFYSCEFDTGYQAGISVTWPVGPVYFIDKRYISKPWLLLWYVSYERFHYIDSGQHMLYQETKVSTMHKQLNAFSAYIPVFFISFTGLNIYRIIVFERKQQHYKLFLKI